MDKIILFETAKSDVFIKQYKINAIEICVQAKYDKEIIIASSQSISVT